MKKTIMTTMFIAMLAIFSVNAQKQMDKFMIQVDGLGCPFCAYGLEKKFKEFKGIKNVKIDIETGDFSFSYPAEKELTMSDVIKQVEKAGYTPVNSKIMRANGKIESSEDDKAEINPKSLVHEEVFVVIGILFLGLILLSSCKEEIPKEWAYKSTVKLEGVNPIGIANVDGKIWLSDGDHNRLIEMLLLVYLF